MLKKLKVLSGIILIGAVVSNAAFANVSLTPNKYNDPVKQFKYVYDSAINNNDTTDNYTLGTYYENGYGTQKDIIKAYVWYRLASANNPALEKSLDRVKKEMNADQISEGDKEYETTLGKILAQNSYNVNHTGFD